MRRLLLICMVWILSTLCSFGQATYLGKNFNDCYARLKKDFTAIEYEPADDYPMLMGNYKNTYHVCLYFDNNICIRSASFMKGYTYEKVKDALAVTGFIHVNDNKFYRNGINVQVVYDNDIKELVTIFDLER